MFDMSFYLGGGAKSDVHPLGVTELLDIPEFQRVHGKGVSGMSFLRANEYKYDTEISCPTEKTRSNFLAVSGLHGEQTDQPHLQNQNIRSACGVQRQRLEWTAHFNVATRISPSPLLIRSFRSRSHARPHPQVSAGSDSDNFLQSDDDLVDMGPSVGFCGRRRVRHRRRRAVGSRDAASPGRNLQPEIQGECARSGIGAERQLSRLPRLWGPNLKGSTKSLKHILVLRRDPPLFRGKNIIHP